ncbi:MAG TPA: GldG family protein [Acidimicrobiales bacterium]|nr:GldG family protein [Acidimicrobiales bacterium]
MSRSRRRAVLIGLAIVVAVVVGNVVAYAHNAQADLSATHHFSLAPQTKGVLDQVKAPLKVTAFLNKAGAEARDARFLLARYQELNHHISFSVIDPDADPTAARRFGISQYSTVVVMYKGRRVEAPAVDELDVSTAILRAVRGGTKTVCVLAGHGEPALDDQTGAGLSKVGDILRHNAYDVRTVDLTVGQPAVPADCAALFDFGPRDPFGPQEVQAINAYAKAAGRVMLVTSSLTRADPNPLTVPWGVHFLGGLVVDPQRSEGGDPTNVVIEDLPSASPVVDGVNRLQFPASAGVAVDPGLRDGLTVERLAVTSGASWVESNPDNELQFDKNDLPGPVVVATASDDSHVDTPSGLGSAAGGHIVRTRVLITASDTWLTNDFLDRLSNRRFFVNGLAWLTQEEQLLATTAQVSTDRSLPLTAERQARILVITVGLVPGLIIGAGLLAHFGWRRRRRRA